MFGNVEKSGGKKTTLPTQMQGWGKTVALETIPPLNPTNNSNVKSSNYRQILDVLFLLTRLFYIAMFQYKMFHSCLNLKKMHEIKGDDINTQDS